jgi:hypothetical protein
VRTDSDPVSESRVLKKLYLNGAVDDLQLDGSSYSNNNKLLKMSPNIFTLRKILLLG